MSMEAYQTDQMEITELREALNTIAVRSQTAEAVLESGSESGYEIYFAAPTPEEVLGKMATKLKGDEFHKIRPNSLFTPKLLIDVHTVKDGVVTTVRQESAYEVIRDKIGFWGYGDIAARGVNDVRLLLACWNLESIGRRDG